MSRRPHKPAGDTPTPSPKKPRGRGRGRGHDRGVGRELYQSATIPGGLLADISGMYTQNKKSDVECGRDETAALVKYIALYYSVEKGQPDEKLFPWATTKKEEFWDR
ncbi:uncharacterized protein LOC144924640 [Branchiostoma floridae x Branchiostoma belcheri]